MQVPDAVRTLARDLDAVFGKRLQCVVAYARADRLSGATPTLAVVDRVLPEDLAACAARVAAWHARGLDTPLILGAGEFARSLDAFPFEFGAILADHAVVVGESPFDGLRVEPGDLRRACEVQARSHLLHLREGYLETSGRSDALADLIQRSARPLAALLNNLARLPGAHVVDETLREVVSHCAGGAIGADEARRLLPAYLGALERLTADIDRWSVS